MTRLWELFARLGEAVLEVLEAEVRALGSDLRNTGKRLLLLLLWLLVAVQLLVVSAVFLGFAVVRLLDLRLAPWAAALLAGTALLVSALGVGWWAWRGLQSLEAPLATVKRRVEDHTAWWRNEIAASPAPEKESAPRDV